MKITKKSKTYEETIEYVFRMLEEFPTTEEQDSYITLRYTKKRGFTIFMKLMKGGENVTGGFVIGDSRGEVLNKLKEGTECL